MIRLPGFWALLGLIALTTACGGASSTTVGSDGMAGSGTGGDDGSGGSGGSGTGGQDGTGGVSASCSNGLRDKGSETDVDCGGTCAPCDEGLFCSQAEDCKSLVCDIKVSGSTIGVCQPSTCTDSVKNGAETGMDCGGDECSTCGNGEACATGADCTTGICNNHICTPANCGDGVKSASEACDEGGATATCTAVCTISTCGDGYTNAAAGEACDGAGESFTCDADCTTASCGDGHANAAAGEDCDTDGETATCTALCATSSCGDGYTNTAAGEVCDTGGASVSCDSDCTLPVCGDGVPNGPAGEQCDDGNTVDDDGCSAECAYEGSGQTHVFSFVDANVNDVENLALSDFFTSFTSVSTDFILFEIDKGNGAVNAWCAERADWYATTYVANVNANTGIQSGNWNKYFRVGGGAWSAATTQSYTNYYGYHCSSQGGWCSEWETSTGAGGSPLRNAFIPDQTSWTNGELFSDTASYNAGWTLRLVVGPTRQEACGF